MLHDKSLNAILFARFLEPLTRAWCHVFLTRKLYGSPQSLRNKLDVVRLLQAEPPFCGRVLLSWISRVDFALCVVSERFVVFLVMIWFWQCEVRLFYRLNRILLKSEICWRNCCFVYGHLVLVFPPLRGFSSAGGNRADVEMRPRSQIHFACPPYIFRMLTIC